MTEPGTPLLEIRGLKKHFPLPHSVFQKGAAQTIHAVDGVDLVVHRGETLALVGESGCGKSTLGRAVLGLSPVTAGEIRFEGDRIDNLSRARFRDMRRRIQVVFQDPFSSLNPRMRVRDIVGEPLVNFGLARRGPDLEARVSDLLDQVHLPRDAGSRYPHEFSGGQRQRIGIARALILRPALIVCDEPVSALDVSIQAQILNLLVDLKRDLGLSYLFISHDLSVVRYFADRVLVMYLGRIVESAGHATLWRDPRHPYTKALLAAVPSTDPTHRRGAPPIKGELSMDITAGCRFSSRCPAATDRCRTEEPLLRPVGESHHAACHYA